MKTLDFKYPFKKVPYISSSNIAKSFNNISKKADTISGIQRDIIPEKERVHHDKLANQSKNHQLNNRRVNLATIDSESNPIISAADSQDDGIMQKFLFTVKKKLIAKQRSKQRLKEPQTRNTQKPSCLFNIKSNYCNSNSNINSSFHIKRLKLKNSQSSLIKDNSIISITHQQQNSLNTQTISTVYSDRVHMGNMYKEFFYPALNKDCSKIMLKVLKNEANSKSILNSIRISLKNSKALPKSFSEKGFKVIKMPLKESSIGSDDGVKYPLLNKKNSSSLIGKDKEIYHNTIKKQSYRFFDTIL